MSPIFFYLLLAPLALFALSQAMCIVGVLTKIQPVEFYGRSLASFIALTVCATYGTIASACLNLAGYGGLGQWTTARSFKWTMWFFTGVWFEIDEEGRKILDNTRPAVFVGNHQTELDVLYLGHVFPKYTSVTAKRSLKFTPFLGWFMALSKTVFIERSSRTQAFAAFDAAAQQMSTQRQSVFIFPEGTRSYYDHPDLLPFKKGAFHMAIQAQVPIVPIVVANYSNVLNPKKKIFRPGRIPIRVLQPVETKGLSKENMQGVLEEVRRKMLETLQELTKEAREDGIAVGEEETSANLNGPAKSSGVDIAKG